MRRVFCDASKELLLRNLFNIAEAQFAEELLRYSQYTRGDNFLGGMVLYNVTSLLLTLRDEYHRVAHCLQRRPNCACSRAEDAPLVTMFPQWPRSGGSVSFVIVQEQMRVLVQRLQTCASAPSFLGRV